MTTKKIRKRIYDNKVKHDFSLTDINQEWFSGNSRLRFG